MTKRLVVASGGFDPLHRGHLNLFRAAKALGDSLAVIVESDAHVAKKHPVVMRQMDRVALVRELPGVDLAFANNDEGGDCSGLLTTLRPAIYAVGPDHPDPTQLPEWKVCSTLGISVVCLNGLDKDASSSSSRLIQPQPEAKRWNNPPVAVGAIITRDGKVLVGSRGQPDGLGLLDLPGGFLEEGETLEECLWREVDEEVGIALHAGEHRYQFSSLFRHADGRQVLAVHFICEVNRFAKPVSTPELTDLRWIEATGGTSSWANPADHQAVQSFFLSRSH